MNQYMGKEEVLKLLDSAEHSCYITGGLPIFGEPGTVIYVANGIISCMYHNGFFHSHAEAIFELSELFSYCNRSKAKLLGVEKQLYSLGIIMIPIFPKYSFWERMKIKLTKKLPLFPTPQIKVVVNKDNLDFNSALTQLISLLPEE